MRNIVRRIERLEKRVLEAEVVLSMRIDFVSPQGVVTSTLLIETGKELERTPYSQSDSTDLSKRSMIS